MKKYALFLFLVAFLFSCDPDASPKFIDESVFNDMREKCEQDISSSYSFDCIIGLHTTPYTYAFHFENANGIIKKKYSLIFNDDVKGLTDDEISAKLLKRKEELGDAYEESYEKICIENINSIDDIFSFISTIYQKEAEKYKQTSSTSYFVSKIEYDGIYSFPSYFYLRTKKNRPMMVGGDMGISVRIKNFQQI